MHRIARIVALFMAVCFGAVVAAEVSDEEAEGLLLVLNKHDDTLMLFDVPAHRPIATVKVGREPHEVAVTPDGRKAYVANARDATVSVIDLASASVVKTVRSERFSFPHGLAVTPDGRHLVLTSEGSQRLFVIDTAGDTVSRSVTTTQKNAHMVALDPKGTRAWIPNIGSDSVSLVKIPELKILKNLPVGPGPEGIATTPNGRFVLVALQRTEQLVILDASSGAALVRLPTGRTPVRVAVTPNSHTALVANRGSDDVTIVDVLGRRAKGSTTVGQHPGGIAINARGTRAYVCNNNSNSVSVVSIPGFEVTGTIPVGAHPDGIAFVPRRPAAGRPRVAGRP